MKKQLFIFVIATLNIVSIFPEEQLPIAAPVTEQVAPAPVSPYYHAERAEDIRPFFIHVQEQLPLLPAKIAETLKKEPVDQKEIEYLKFQLKLFTIVNLIAEQNIEALKQMSIEDLQLYGQIQVPSDKFKENMDGNLICRMLGGENALVFVIYHSTLNKTEKDNEKTGAMLELLLQKGLNSNAIGAQVYWITKNPSDAYALDYVSTHSLPELALLYSSPQVLELLFKYGATLPEDDVTRILAKLKQGTVPKMVPYIKEFKPVLSNYLAQSKK